MNMTRYCLKVQPVKYGPTKTILHLNYKVLKTSDGPIPEFIYATWIISIRFWYDKNKSILVAS